MSQKIFVYGPAGHGKTSSLRNLPPARTGVINCDRKPLPLAGWKKNFVTVMNGVGPDLTKSNYIETSKPANVLATLKAWEKREDIDYIAFDTLTHMMSSEFMRTIMDKGFDKFSRLGKDVSDVLDFIRDSKKNIVVMAHNDTVLDADGNKINKMRSFGKLVDEKIEVPSLFTTVLIPQIKRSADKVSYIFKTQSDGNDFAKSPARFGENDTVTHALPYEIVNDIKKVFDLLEAFDNE